ncbi:MAG: universal stress protein [Pseudohongiellaceae bacterium]
MLKSLLLATDFSERSDRALRRAVLLARQFKADLRLVHVIDDDQPDPVIAAEREVAQKLLADLTSSLDENEGVTSESLVITAPPFSGILRAVDEFRPDLLIIGPHRRQALRDVFLGTTAERTFRAVDCPTLMANAMPARNYRHCLLTTDLAPESLKTLARHIELLEAISNRHSLLHVYELPTSGLLVSGNVPEQELEQLWRDARQQAEDKLNDFVTALVKETDAAPDSLQQLVRAQRLAAAEEILACASDADADLLVVTNRNRSTLDKMFLGSVSSTVLKSAQRDVLVLPFRTTAAQAN